MAIVKPIRSKRENSTSGNRQSGSSKDQLLIKSAKCIVQKCYREKVHTKYVEQYSGLSTEHIVSNWEISKRKDQLSDAEKTGVSS